MKKVPTIGSHSVAADRPEWVVTRRRYHGVPDGRFVVHRKGELRGVCECWDEGVAELIAAQFNRNEVMLEGVR